MINSDIENYIIQNKNHIIKYLINDKEFETNININKIDNTNSSFNLEDFELNEPYKFHDFGDEDKYFLKDKQLNYFIDKYINQFITHEKQSKFLEFICEWSNVEFSEESILKYQYYLDFNALSKNKNTKWNLFLFRKFIKKINITHVFINENFPLTEDLLDEFSEDIDWALISSSKNISTLSKEIIKSNKNLIYKVDEMDKYDFNYNNYYNCLSMNKFIKWDENDIEFINKNLDKWSVLKYSKLDSSLLKYFINELNQWENNGYTSHRMSDWIDFTSYQETGWQVYFDNPNTILDNYFLEEFYNTYINVMERNGNAREGLFFELKKVLINDLILNKKKKLTLNEYIHYFGTKNDIINKEIYNEILKKFLINNQEFLKIILK